MVLPNKLLDDHVRMPPLPLFCLLAICWWTIFSYPTIVLLNNFLDLLVLKSQIYELESLFIVELKIFEILGIFLSNAFDFWLK